GYKTAQGTLEVPDVGGSRFSIGTQVHWQDLTQIQYFGMGPDTSRDARTDYRLNTGEVIAFTSYRTSDALTFEVRGGRVSRPDLGSSTGFFDRGYPDAMFVYPNDPG